jgi:glutaredoxin-related protein
VTSNNACTFIVMRQVKLAWDDTSRTSRARIPLVITAQGNHVIRLHAQ